MISEINISIMKEEDSPDIKRPSTGRKQPRKAWATNDNPVAVAPLKLNEEEEIT
jgi:hypothetical protein